MLCAGQSKAPPNSSRGQPVKRSYQTTAIRITCASSKWGFRAPAPVIGQDPEDYRRDLCVKAKKQLIFEPQIYSACAEAAKRPDSVPPGEMRMLKTRDQNGQEIITWLGQESFVKDMGRPGRRVVSFMHRYNRSGVAFR
jgi:hypothetical protein